MERWLARFALLVSVGGVAVIMGGWGALGGPLSVLIQPSPTGTATARPTGTARPTTTASASPSRSPCTIPLPQTCPSPAGPTPSPTPTASPSATPTTGPTRPPAEEEPERHRSRISIRFDVESSVFLGTVRSATKCERLRDVVLRRVREGRDPIVGQDVTNRRGKWKVRLPGANGRFYAQVIKRAFQQGDTRVVCRADRSRTISARAVP
ncbi:MAG: hypothetical protein M3161_00795 [Actinomycetota bacterium]|nr:hypothetical protein [Actinomycetota bacterium]